MKCSCNCDCNSDSSDKNISQEKNCPTCHNTAKNVSSIVVKNLLKKEIKAEVKESDYFICLDSECDTAYFSMDLTQKFTISDLHRTLWFKRNTSPKIACYCNNITDLMLKDAVKNHDLLSWKNIVDFYRKKAICACEKRNPIGECCTPVFYELINEVLKEIGKKPIEIPDSCCEE